jgi:flagellar basal-body rod modification protein FlgD
MAINALDALASSTSSATTAKADAANAADRFLKLLVAQMQNQDPLNPMDNAQVTSQMAQISTVNGIQQLNTTVEGLSGQFVQMQALQGAALVGHDVVVPGKTLDIADGVGQGGFELASPADAVKVEVHGGLQLARRQQDKCGQADFSHHRDQGHRGCRHDLADA